jgi:hypothetical protein
MVDRSTVQTAVRVAAIVFVVAWLFVEALREVVPFWLPFVVLLAAEVEFVVRGRRELSLPRRRRIPPGPEDADLGFGELVEEEDGYRYVPPPTRPPRGRGGTLAWLAGAVAVVALFALAARADRAATWRSLADPERARTVSRLTSEASIVAGRPVTIRCDEQYAFTGAGSDTLGIAFPRAGIAYLDQGICRALHDLVLDGKDRGERTGEAIVVLAHEAVHLRGERREGVTECLALQEGVRLGARLGLDERRARALMGAELDSRLAERSVIRAAYALPTSCRDGGSLDLSPGDSRFP